MAPKGGRESQERAKRGERVHAQRNERRSREHPGDGAHGVPWPPRTGLEMRLWTVSLAVAAMGLAATRLGRPPSPAARFFAAVGDEAARRDRSTLRQRHRSNWRPRSEEHRT